MPTPWTKAIFQQQHDVLLRVQRRILDSWPEEYEAIFSNAYYLEVTRKGSTKGGMGGQAGGTIWGRTRGSSTAWGTTRTISPWLERSVIPFAPANCAQEVKDWGARVLCHCNDGVIGDIVEILDRTYQ